MPRGVGTAAVAAGIVFLVLYVITGDADGTLLLTGAGLAAYFHIMWRRTDS